MAPDAICAKLFNDGVKSGNPNITQYVYHGDARGIYVGVENPPPFITWDGCRALCGTGPAYYEWTQVSASISTWVLPVVGLLLQAPFESNLFWKTVFAMSHWIGSPISSLSSILWNIKVFGKCSLIVDMASPFEYVPGEESQFEQIRDSLYILSMMNQFSIKQTMPRVEAERLIRIALFSDSLQLEVVEDDTRNLVKRRRKLARTLREGRKKGVVPVFISLMWFLFSLVTSIQQAYGQLGWNATAHNLAMGLLLSWLPTFILCSIVDRNPTQAEATRTKLNKLVDAVRKALLNPELRETYIKETGRPQKSFTWTKILQDEHLFREDFFARFAGQGRVRWHYGIAHGILAGIEESYVAKQGRNWLRNSEEARTALVRGPEHMQGLSREFNLQEIWQILASFTIVGSSIFGAFLLSYWTPTIGLGCRSGGYMVFFILACASLFIELICWRYLPAGSVWDDDPISRFGSHLQRRMSRGGNEHRRVPQLIRQFVWWWQNSWKRDLVEAAILRPIECINTIWLIYIVLAQTTGSYTTCDCQCSTWGPGGGYMDFETQIYYLQLGIGWVWGISTAIVCAPMFIAFTYIVVEWCMVSNLSTVDYESARRGLMRTRKFRLAMQPVSDMVHVLKKPVLAIWSRVASQQRPNSRKGSLRWTPTPNIKIILSRDEEDRNESAIEDGFISPNYTQNSQLLALDHLPSPGRSVNRSPRSSFGQNDGEELVRPKSFD